MLDQSLVLLVVFLAFLVVIVVIVKDDDNLTMAVVKGLVQTISKVLTSLK